MAMLWVLEKKDHVLPRITDMLIGDFAVRAVASTQSLTSVLRINSSQIPDAIIIDYRSKEWSLTQILSLAIGSLPGSALIAVVPDENHLDEVPQSVRTLAFDPDSMPFALSLRQLIGRDGQGKVGSNIRYRDLVLDQSNLQLKFGESKEVVTLPQKEMQLLKLLVNHCGRVICREEISSSIWSGIKVSPRTIDSHISRLRTKLVGSNVTIRSVYGGGYLLR